MKATARSRRRSGHRSNGRGTLRIDRVFPGVGRIAVASGFKDPLILRQLNDHLSDLNGAARNDILQLVKDGTITLRDLLLSARRLGPGKSLATLPAEEFLSVKHLIERWEVELRASDGTLSQHNRNQLAGVRRVVGPSLQEKGSRLLLRDLPQIVAEYRDRCKKADKATEWNRTRSYLTRFVEFTAGQDSIVLSYLKRTRRHNELDLRAERQGLRPAALKQLLDSLDTETASCARAMALTGFGPDEYWNCEWEVCEERGYIWVNGTKRHGRRRAVPLIEVPKKPRISRKTFERRFAIAQQNLPILQRTKPYDLRRTYSLALLQSQVPDRQHPRLMGHGPENTTARYQREKVITPERVAELRRYARHLRKYFQPLLSPPPSPEEGMPARPPYASTKD